MEALSTVPLVQISYPASSPQVQQLEFKPSRFNARSNAPDGSLLLYNSYSGAFTAFPASVSQEVVPKLSRVGFKGELSGLNKYLYDRGFLVSSKADELARARLLIGQQQHKQDVLELILLASEECNFRCVYCYEEFPRGTMEPWVAEGVLNLLRARAGRLKHFKLDWFGGEPLLGWQAIAAVAPEARSICEQNGIAFSSGMTTNGYLLTPDRFSKLIEWGVTGYQITLDGPGECHDSHRPLKGGGSSFQGILDNLLAMHNTTFQFGVAIRVNYDQGSINQVPALLSLLAELKGDERFRIRFYPIGKWGGKNDDSLEVCGTSAEDELHKLNTLASLEGFSPESRLRTIQPSGNNVCYAARPHNLLIGADGKIMKCTVALDTKDYNIVGNLLADGTAQIDIDKFARWVTPYFEDDAACRKCFHLPVCQGNSCPLPRIENDQRPCPPAKQQIGRTLQGIWATGKTFGRQQSLQV